MELGDLYVRVGPIDNGHCQIVVRLFPEDGSVDEIVSHLELDELVLKSEADPPPIFFAEIASIISGHIHRASAGGLVPQGYWPSRLFLEVKVPQLFAADWERGLFGALQPLPVLTRFVSVSDERLLRKFQPPMSVLELCDPGDPAAAPSEHVIRYFGSSRVAGTHAAGMLKEIAAGQYDIVRLVAGANSEIPGVTELRNALNVSGARLLVLQSAAPFVFRQALDFSHRLVGAGGPATVVLDQPAPDTLDDLYMALVHSHPVPSVLQQGFRARAAMVHAIGGDRALLFKPYADRLLRDMERSAASSHKLLDRLSAAKPRAIRFGGPAPAPVQDAIAEISQGASELRNAYDFARETGAWIPIEGDARAHARHAAKVEEIQRSIDRVVNVGMFDGEREMRDCGPLAPGGAYELSVQIGRRTSWSLIDGGAAFPEDAIAREYTATGVELRVVVFAASFEIAESDRPLHLDRPPAESAELRFPLKTPSAPGDYRIRICVYHRLNLLQSVLLRVAVGEASQGQAIRAEVEFALSSTMADLERLPPREINILMNEADDGTHTFAVVGTAFRTSFDFGESEMQSAVNVARQALLGIAADTSTDPPAYRFDNTNATTIERLEQDTILLANLGYQLYSKIITPRTREFEKALGDALGRRSAMIQIAAVKSARYVFPWALIYDKRLVSGRRSCAPNSRPT